MLLLLDEKPRNPLHRLKFETKYLFSRYQNSVLNFKRRNGPDIRSFELCRELKRRGIEFSYNIYDIDRFFEVTVVLRDPLALAWALQQKRRGNIGTLIAGPNIVDLPHQYDFILESSEIDAVIFSSPWVKNLFFEYGLQNLSDSYICPIGVDETEWRPGLGRKELVLVLDKHSGVLDPIVSTLLQKNYQVEVLKEGRFRRYQYRDFLQKSRFAVILSDHEPQGICSFEAWSCDVPTLNWNPGSFKAFGRVYEGVSSCFYLTPMCGTDFKDVKNFASALDKLEWNFKKFRPREFILNGYTISQSVDRFLKLLDLPYSDLPLLGMDQVDHQITNPSANKFF